MEVGLRDGDGNVVDTVFDFASIPVVLSFDSCGVVATLCRAGLVDAPDRAGVCLFGGDDGLATIAEFLFIPDDGFKKPLQCPGCDALLECNRFGVFSLHARKQTANVNGQETTAFEASKTIREPSEKLTEQFAQLCDILNQHETAFRGFVVKQITRGRSFLFTFAVNSDNS